MLWLGWPGASDFVVDWASSRGMCTGLAMLLCFLDLGIVLAGVSELGGSSLACWCLLDLGVVFVGVSELGLLCSFDLVMDLAMLAVPGLA